MVMAQAWTSLQRTETLLIRAAAQQNPAMRARLFRMNLHLEELSGLQTQSVEG